MAVNNTATLFIRVPRDWPDLVVTSYMRKTGAHSTGRAFDFTIKGISDRSPGSRYWFYYFQTAFLLWAAQRQGIVAAAAPPYCPHFHCVIDPKIARMGIEFTKPVNGDCQFISGFTVNRLDYFQNVQFFKQVRKDIAADYLNSWRNWFAELDYKVSSNAKYITVHTNGYIGADDLQAKLLDLFGNGSASQQIADNAAQIVGFNNAQSAGDAITGSPWFTLAIMTGFVALLLYFSKNKPQQ